MFSSESSRAYCKFLSTTLELTEIKLCVLSYETILLISRALLFQGTKFEFIVTFAEC